MIKVKNNIKIKEKIKLLVTNISITIHLGKNPKNGGNPPNESKTIKRDSFIIILKFVT